MFRLGFFLTILVAAGAIRFDELTAGKTHFHGIRVEKYVNSMNRLREINRLLAGITEPIDRFEDIDWTNDGDHDPRENPFLYEGDIVLDERQLDGLVESHEYQLALKEGRPFDRFFSIGLPWHIWKTFPIPWSLNAKNPPAGGADIVRTGIKAWEDNTCVTFQENGNVTDSGLVFFNGGACYSNIGMTWGAANEISLGNRCRFTYIVAHEIGHALGLFHTQTRYDRDKYVDVIKANIIPKETGQFDIPDPYWQASTHGIPYDMGSVMHYGRYTFGLNRNQPTLLPKDGNFNETMGQSFEIAFTDAKEINMIYCDHVCPNKLPCENGGYTDPKDCTKCRCPVGLIGTHCENFDARTPTDCGVNTDLQATRHFRRLRGAGGTGTPTIYKITAPAGRKVHIVLDEISLSGTGLYTACQDGFIEFKYGSQYESAGARFCDRSLPEPRTMTSEKNEALVIYKPLDDTHSFVLRYKYV